MDEIEKAVEKITELPLDAKYTKVILGAIAGLTASVLVEKAYTAAYLAIKNR